MIESWDSHSFLIKKKIKTTSIIYPIFKNIGDLILPKLKDQNILNHLQYQNNLTI
jgi:hypothetical protein